MKQATPTALVLGLVKVAIESTSNLTAVVATLDRLGRSTVNMLTLADELKTRGAALRVLNLGGTDVDTATATGSVVFTVMAALAQMELEIKRERINDSVTRRGAAGADLGGRRPTFTNSQIRNAQRLVEAGEPASQVARDLGMSRATLYRRTAALPPPDPDPCTPHSI